MDAINSFVAHCKNQFNLDFLWGKQDKNKHMKVRRQTTGKLVSEKYSRKTNQVLKSVHRPWGFK